MEEVEVRQNDGWLDALAFLAACLREDTEGIEAVLGNCDGAIMVSALASMLFCALDDRQVDAAAWVENEQQMALGT